MSVGGAYTKQYHTFRRLGNVGRGLASINYNRNIEPDTQNAINLHTCHHSIGMNRSGDRTFAVDNHNLVYSLKLLLGSERFCL